MATKPKEFICKCFYSRNIFLQKYKLHVTYKDDEQFNQEFRQDLRMKGCATTEQFETVMNEIRKEMSRRKSFHQDAFQRYKTISDTYHRIHPQLWKLETPFVDERLLQIVNSLQTASNKENAESLIVQNGGNIVGPRLYIIPVFSLDFCKRLVEELSHFEDSPCPKGRPNTMSNYGISLDEIGMSEGLLTPLISWYIQPLSTALFGEWCDAKLDSFRSFSVLYGPGKDTELSMHFDNAEVTLNVCLSDKFEGGELEFGGLWDEPAARKPEFDTVVHQMGLGVLHLGQHTHRALPIVSGTRCNLILWMRSSAIRNQLCRMCESKPDLVEVPFAGDGFTCPPDDLVRCAAL